MSNTDLNRSDMVAHIPYHHRCRLHCHDDDDDDDDDYHHHHHHHHHHYRHHHFIFAYYLIQHI